MGPMKNEKHDPEGGIQFTDELLGTTGMVTGQKTAGVSGWRFRMVAKVIDLFGVRSQVSKREKLGQSRYIETPCIVNCDNTQAMCLGLTGVVTERSKHIDLKYHICCEQVEVGNITFEYVPSEKNFMDRVSPHMIVHQAPKAGLG
ncbi:hypothetical protein J437_LFUL017489 [Ladona fulva]|uniref:Uncharacterized protein n=1 Tax=Ladona fulva TaxID=123851 RepID=A0A8K0P822_LADFU|nr:hypothetical protein J437_LFUL017489 [Ladona fulva]